MAIWVKFVTLAFKCPCKIQIKSTFIAQKWCNAMQCELFEIYFPTMNCDNSVMLVIFTCYNFPLLFSTIYISNARAERALNVSIRYCTISLLLQRMVKKAHKSASAVRALNIQTGMSMYVWNHSCFRFCCCCCFYRYRSTTLLLLQ